MISVDEKQLTGKPKHVGDLDGRRVLELHTKGGLSMIVAQRVGKSSEILGTGPHRAVARATAMRHAKEIKWNDLAKGDWIDPSAYEFLMPKWMAFTDEMRALQGL